MPVSAKTAPVHGLWIGDRLGWRERLCVLSWLSAGHPVVVWAYDKLDGVPDGVDVRDARAILPETRIVRYTGSGSVSLFANFFRYHLLTREAGVIWADMDILFLRAMPDMFGDHIFGWEDSGSVGNGLIRLPPDSPVLRDLIALSDARVPVPFWWPVKQRLAQRFRGLVGRHVKVEDLPRGTTGPTGLTAYLRKHDLLRHAQPVSTFAPVHWSRTPIFLLDANEMSTFIEPNTVAVHLFGYAYDRKNGPALPPTGSWLHDMCLKYGVAD